MNVLKAGELWLHGTVGSGFFTPGFTAADVADALAQIGRNKPVIVHLNSGGGVASEGAAIHAVLDQHMGTKKVIIEGVAASAGSLIAMAGDQVIMKKGSVMMLHDPSGFTAGTSDDHRKTVEALEALADSMAEIYADKAGKTADEAREEMKEEVWLKPEQAKAAGYCDIIDPGKARPIAAFDYRLYEKAPERFVALAAANGWEARSDAEADGAAEDEENEEMTETTKKGGTTSSSVATDTPEFKAAVGEAVTAALKERDDKAAEEATKKAAAEAANKGTETTEQITARIRTEEQKRMADITAACTLAGQPTKAATFIAENKSLSEVVDALQAERAKGSDKQQKQTTASGGEKELNNHRSANGQSGQAGDLDVGAAWKRTTDKINARNERFGAR